MGCRPGARASMPDGLLLAQSTRPDLIIVDDRLPQIAGVEVCIQLKSDPHTRATPIILSTSTLTPDLHAYASRAGADSALRKPFRPNDVLLALSTMLG